MINHIRTGDLVARKSYGKDILFRVIDIDQEMGTAVLKGIDWRLIADAPLNDLELVDEDEEERLSKPFRELEQEMYRQITYRRKYMKKFVDPSKQEEIRYREFPGRVFHIDGDPKYLKMCLKEYEKLSIPAAGIQMEESKIPKYVLSLLKEYQPDILVITGHDSYRSSATNPHDVKNYRNSAYFIESVRIVRSEYERHRDNLFIFAGACQSYFDGIMQAGANFASSPDRINIHALDPVYVVERAAFTSIRDSIPILEMIGNTKAGKRGIGGIESKGTFRLGMPLKEKN